MFYISSSILESGAVPHHALLVSMDKQASGTAMKDSGRPCALSFILLQ